MQWCCLFVVVIIKSEILDLNLGSGFRSQLNRDRSAVCPSPVNQVFGVRVLMYSCSFSASNTLLSSQILRQDSFIIIVMSHNRFPKFLEELALKGFAEVVSDHFSCGTVFHNQISFRYLIR
jgi:hypothetical protein